jgi:hypothetical protein
MKSKTNVAIAVLIPALLALALVVAAYGDEATTTPAETTTTPAETTTTQAAVTATAQAITYIIEPPLTTTTVP